MDVIDRDPSPDSSPEREKPLESALFGTAF